MMKQSARYLTRQRLEQLIKGLRLRGVDGMRQLAEQMDQFRSQWQQAETAIHTAEQAAKESFDTKLAETITQWDEQRQRVWDAAEQRVYQSEIQATQQEARLRQEVKRQNEAFTTEVKNRVADIEKRFLVSKDKQIAKLNQTKERIERLAGELAVVEQETAMFLAQRGLPHQIQSGTAPTTMPTTSQAAIETCIAEIQNVRSLLQSLASNRTLRFFESFTFVALYATVGMLLAAGIALLNILSWPFAILIGACVSVAIGIGVMLAVHPWARQLIRAEYPKVQSALAQGHACQRSAIQLALAENDAQLKRTAEKRDTRIAEAVQWRENAIKEFNARVKSEMSRIRTTAANERNAARTLLSSGLVQVDEQGKQQEMAVHADYDRLQAEFRQQLLAVQQDYENRLQVTERFGLQRLQAASNRALAWFNRGAEWNEAQFVDWNKLASDDAWSLLDHPVLPLGKVRVDDLLPEAARAEGQGGLTAPVNFEPIRDHYLTITADPASMQCQELVRSLLLRTMTTLQPGKVQVGVIDPSGLGRDFGWLMALGDYDPELISHRIWTQSTHITKHISQLALKAEDFIQQALRDQYSTIIEYNREAGALAEPFRVLLWSSFPLGMDDTAWKSLLSILDAGARCGIISIFIVPPEQSWDVPDRREVLMRRGLHLTLDGSRKLVVHSPELAGRTVEPFPGPPEALVPNIVHQIGRRARLASRVEVPLSRIAPAPEQWWQADSSGSLEIPIGQSGVGRVQNLRLGVGTAQHAIIAGKTGSGKSTLLHAIIASAAVKYSPDRLRLVLLDFKKGVEFQVYSQAELPHADIIGIESQREFGLSALEYVDQCMQQRGQMFRELGVQDIQSWNLLRPQQQLPRMLIVIDEFQELFVEDDKLTGQVSLILDRIVRQGRSFGVHAVLSSQTLAGAYSLPRTTMGQMGVRIALQCDASDAQLIFADDNPAAARLNHPGQAVYNDSGGRIEGNQAMQIGWLNKSELTGWLESLPTRGYHNNDPSSNLLGRCVVFDGNRAATWNRDAATRAIEAAKSELNPDACWCIVGESVAISPAVTVPLTDQAGRNMMIVSGDDAPAAGVVMSIAGTFVSHHVAKRTPQIVLIQASKPTDARCLSLSKRMKQLRCELQEGDARSVDQLLSELHQTLRSRIDTPDSYSEWKPILLVVLNIGRLRTLRPEDEFGMGSFGETKLTPDKQLEEILREGPTHHIHVLIWSENANTVGRWLGRAAQREIEIRILGQMSANDSTHLIDSVAAAHLGAHVMLLHDDATSTEARFRPYEIESLDSIASFANPSLEAK